MSTLHTGKTISELTDLADDVMTRPACQVEMHYTPWDQNSYICGKANWQTCSDCGKSTCTKHSEECEVCHEDFCPGCIDAHQNDCGAAEGSRR